MTAPAEAVAAATLVSAGDSYESWPVITACPNGDTVIIYGDGTVHATPTVTRQIMAVRRPAGSGVWGAPYTLIDTVDDDSVFSVGPDGLGNLLVIARQNNGSDWKHYTYRSTDNLATVSQVAEIVVSPIPVLISPIVNVAGVGLMAHVHQGGGEPAAVVTKAHGVILSTDNGGSWTYTQIATGLTDANWPVEARFLDLGGGEVLGIARNQTIGGPLFQMHRTSGGVWTVQATNIVDGRQTPTALLLNGDVLTAYYYDRNSGKLRRSVSSLAAVLASPLAWARSEVVATGAASALDAGYPHAVVRDGNHLVTYYSGAAPTTGIYVVELDA